jgi:hypothetical protein
MNAPRFAPGRSPGQAHHVPHPATALSRAVGLFVDMPKGPVLLNYDLDECRPACRTGRFVKPVYPGMTIQVRFTVKEKVDQEKRTPEDVSKGLACPGQRPGVKFLVDLPAGRQVSLMRRVRLWLLRRSLP